MTHLLQRTDVTAEEYEVKGTHFGILMYSDYNLGQRNYWDQFNFLSFLGINIDYGGFYSFFGPGPVQPIAQSVIDLGRTYSYAQTAPQVRVILTIKNSGTVVPVPENEDYSNALQTSGTDRLGPLPMGEGRPLSGAAGQVYTAPMMLIGQVSPSSAYSKTFRWLRKIRRRSWYIRKNADGTQWIVTQRTRRPSAPAGFAYDDDTDPFGTFNDSTPSGTGKIYIYDNSAIAPTELAGSSLQIGEFIREEKDFLYQVEYWDGSRWFRVANAPVGQIIVVKRTATTSQFVNDWQGIENSNALRKLDGVITTREVRSTVGGNLPIVIDSSTNQ